MFLSVLTLAAVAQSALPSSCGHTAFSRTIALTRVSDAVCVGPDPAGQPGVLLLRLTTTGPDGRSTVSWLSTRNCPAALRRLEALEELALPRPDLPGFGQEPQQLVLDGAGYRLEINALYTNSGAALVVESNVGTPLARWVDETLSALRACPAVPQAKTASD